MSLQLPYCLQLIRVLSERLGICSAKLATSVEQSRSNDGSDDHDYKLDTKHKANEKGNIHNINVNSVTPDTNTNDANITTPDHFSNGVGVHDNSTATPDNNNRSINNNRNEEKRTIAKLVTVGGGSASLAVHAPMLRWFNVIMQCRGMELYELQRQMSATNASHAMTNPIMSPPKDFIAPLLQQYRSMCDLHDKLAMLHGRLSIFNSVRPNEKQNFFNAPRNLSTSNMESGYFLHARQGKLPMTKSRAKHGAGVSKRVISTLHDDVLFPRMFTQVRGRTNGPYVVRVRSRLASREKKKQMQLKNVPFVRQKAKQLALRKLGKVKDETIDGKFNDDDDINENNDM